MENQTSSDNQVVKFIQYFIFAQVVFYLYYNVIPLMRTFRTSGMIDYLIITIILVLLLTAGFGIRRQRRWSIIVYWIFVAAVAVSPIFLPSAFFMRILEGIGYSNIILNTTAVVYLSFNQWKSWK